MPRITSQALEKMIRHCRKEYPNEACGYLGGQGEEITTVYPIRNDAASPTWYEMNPLDQIKAQREIRGKGLQHLAVYHSHVATEAYPSRRDVERATAIQDFYDGRYLLVTLKDEGRAQARSFWIRDGHVTEEELVEAPTSSRVRQRRTRDLGFKGEIPRSSASE